jgi:Na+-translocating ferredoxin:NAD+ oxidoreductase subunit D
MSNEDNPDSAFKTPCVGGDNIDRCKKPLSVAPPPHIRRGESVSAIMWRVNLSLAPAAVFGIVNFGVTALVTIIISISGAVATEAAIQFLRKKPVTINDGSAFLTGLLLALCLPAHLPWYMPLLGSIVAISLAKHAMGGLGNNVFNPAHVGRAFLLASYPVAMTSFTASNLSFRQPFSMNNFSGVDAVSCATPLGILKHEGYSRLLEIFGSRCELYKTMLIGNHAGSIGETSVLLLLVGGIFLVVKGYIKWQPPIVMILTVGIFGWIFGGKGCFFSGDPVFHIMAGGLIIGAFFMITDPVTVPMSLKGQILFAFGAGALTILIRLAGGYPEGVCYAILLMNAVTPVIDKYIYPKKFGT